jgi:hypothetical protein
MPGCIQQGIQYKKDRQLQVKDIVDASSPGIYLQAQKSAYEIPNNGKKDTGQKCNLNCAPEILLKRKPRTCRYHVGMQAMIPEGITLDPFPEVVPEYHRITLRRSAI